MTPANTYLAANLLGSDLTADAAGLHWNFGANDHHEFDFHPISEPPSCNCYMVLQDYINDPNDLIVVGRNFQLTSTPPSSDLIAASVPEPATWAMMLLGFAGLGFVFRRRRAAIGAH